VAREREQVISGSRVHCGGVSGLRRNDEAKVSGWPRRRHAASYQDGVSGYYSRRIF
jgi:hypothetical protein